MLSACRIEGDVGEKTSEDVKAEAKVCSASSYLSSKPRTDLSFDPRPEDVD